MNIRHHTFTSNWVILCLFLCSIFCGSGAVLKIFYVDELCYGTSSATLNLRFQKSAILASIPSGPMDCEITLKPEEDTSVVVAFYRYNIGSNDKLVFKDSHNFQLSLTGNAVFLDERKSLTFEGPVTIHLVTNYTNAWDRQKFQLVFTQVHDAPCGWDEFKCRNNKCIPNNMACDKHNHCGDISDESDCSPEKTMKEEEFVHSRMTQSGLIIIVIGSVALGITLIVIIALSIRICVLKKKNAQQPNPSIEDTTSNLQQAPVSVIDRFRQSLRLTRQPTAPPLDTTSSTGIEVAEMQQAAPPSIMGRIRESFRFRRPPTAPPLDTVSTSEPKSDSVEVPSMYPQLPSAPDFSGTDNPEFKSEE